ncbi:hypothetical protein, partial [Burkholderia sp. 3C]
MTGLPLRGGCLLLRRCLVAAQLLFSCRFAVASCRVAASLSLRCRSTASSPDRLAVRPFARLA